MHFWTEGVNLQFEMEIWDVGSKWLFCCSKPLVTARLISER